MRAVAANKTVILAIGSCKTSRDPVMLKYPSIHDRNYQMSMSHETGEVKNYYLKRDAC